MSGGALTKLADVAGHGRSLAIRFGRWRAQRQTSPFWTIGTILVAGFVGLPVITIIWLAAGSSFENWQHLAATILAQSVSDTVLLLAGAGALTAITGTACAWLVTMYRFPGRAILDRLLVLPLAVPTYITAYAYVDLLDYAGPAQSTVRSLLGAKTPADYYFPDIRSLPGAIFLMSSVLYPYVYLAARASFVQQSVCALEVARTLGATAAGSFWRVALPMARPAIAAGVVLVLMECMNDLGAVQHLGVQTLSASISATWLQRGNLGGAAQLSAVAMLFIVALVMIERSARGGRQTHGTTNRQRAIPFETLTGWRGYVALSFGTLPFLAGFIIPSGVIGLHAINHAGSALESGFATAALHSILVATVVAVLAVTLALVVAYSQRLQRSRIMSASYTTAMFGYALPGTVLAIGVLIPFAAFDNSIDAWMRSSFGISTGLLLSGSIAAISLALTIRFLAVALGSVSAGLERISPSIDAAARSLGASPFSVLKRVHIMLILPAAGAAALLVFVDTMKELPATLLLRPFNFDTLATHVYSLAALERFEEACLGASAIVIMGLVPVLLLHQAIANGRSSG